MAAMLGIAKDANAALTTSQLQFIATDCEARAMIVEPHVARSMSEDLREMRFVVSGSAANPGSWEIWNAIEAGDMANVPRSARCASR